MYNYKNLKKVVVALFLVFTMTVVLYPKDLYATETIDTWDGTSDSSWYDSAKDEYEINSAEQLAGLAVLVNQNISFEGKTIKMMVDVDLKGYEWISIGCGPNIKAEAFQGTFDGQNHVIYNLYSHEDSLSNTEENNSYRNGLFGSIYDATIQNLGIEDADIWMSANDRSTYGKGILVDWMTNSTIKNCYTSGTITGGSYIEKYIGGLVGFLNDDNNISGCYSTAVITGNYNGGAYGEGVAYNWWDSLGGIVGASYTGDVTINDCWFGGQIVVNSIQAPVGGIIGYSEGVSIYNCLVATTNIENDGLGNTSWLGYSLDEDATNCFYPNDNKYNTTPKNDESGIIAGTAVSNFNDSSILEGLRLNSDESVSWVEGINNPTFSWDNGNIIADYTAVNDALNKIPVDLSLYTEESVSALKKVISEIDYNKSKREQSIVDSYVNEIESTIIALEYKNADYSNVDEAINKANALNKNDYKNFSAVENAINAVIRGKNITEQSTVDEYANAIEKAINALEKKNPTLIQDDNSSTDTSTGVPTGDDTNILLWGLSSILGLAQIILVIRKKYNMDKIKN